MVLASLTELSAAVDRAFASQYPTRQRMVSGLSNISMNADGTEGTILYLVPGITKEEVKITLSQDNVLTVQGVTRSAGNETDYDYKEHGFNLGDFTSTRKLGKYAQVDGVTLENGILTIKVKFVMPKEMEPTTIEIQ